MNNRPSFARLNKAVAEFHYYNKWWPYEVTASAAHAEMVAAMVEYLTDLEFNVIEVRT
jgi:hypothetical protein